MAKKNLVRGRVIQLIEPSAQRVESDCPIAEACGGCQLRSLDYAAQLEWKRNQVYQALKRIGGFEDVQILPTLGMKEPNYYRNKVQFHARRSQSGQAIMGFYASGSKELVAMPAEGCRLQQEPQNKVVRVVGEILDELGIRIKGVLIRSSRFNGETMLVLVTPSQDLPHAGQLVEKIKAKVPEVVSIYHNINPKNYGPFLGRKSFLLWGKPHLMDKVGSYKFQISPQSFFQVNSEQTEVLYQKALDYANLKGDETVYDLYCGIGTITLFLAGKAKRVIGIEEVPQAVADAQENAKLNRVQNVEFHAGRVEEVLPRLVAKGARGDVVVLDPPRAGAAQEVLEAMARTGVKRVVYVSCNPATLARDLRLLAERGYEIGEVQPVDMFPHTSHVECVVLMSRVEK